MRIAAIHRSRLTALSEAGSVELTLGVRANAGDFTVGDWILVEPQTQTVLRRLGRRTVMERRTEGSRTLQAAAANVDTLFIVTSCNADFNPARLERYLALANQGGTTPVLLLTKADTTEDLENYQSQASQLQRGLEVVTVNPRLSDAANRLAPWCGTGRTVALVGSSGVGKSTLVNTLAGPGQELAQQTEAFASTMRRDATQPLSVRCIALPSAAGSSIRRECERCTWVAPRRESKLCSPRSSNSRPRADTVTVPMPMSPVAPSASL